MTTETTGITAFLDSLPEDRRRTIKAVRQVIRKNIDKPFKEVVQSGMLTWVLPHSVYPNGYHCNPKDPLPFAGIASQKNHIGIHLFCIYTEAGGPDRFRKEWLATGKKLDMGKSCVRVKTLEDIPLDVVGRVFKRMTAKKFVKCYEYTLPDSVKQKLAKAAAKQAAPARKKTTRRV
jgi:hypothetical protein